MIFQGVWPSIAKKPYIFVIFEGGPDPRPTLDLHMINGSKGSGARLRDTSETGTHTNN